MILEADFTDTDLAPVEGLVTGGTGASDQSASRQVLAYIRVSGLDPGATCEFKVRLVPSDGVTGTGSAAASVLGLRWQRRAGAVELSWNDPRDPIITIWQYRQQAGSGSWGLWRNVPGSDAATTTHTVSGLDPGVTYRFQVRAIIRGGRWPNRLPLRRRWEFPTRRF